MIASLSIADPTAALMLTHLEVGPDGRIRGARRGDLRRGRRHFQRHARLRKLLA